MRYPLVIDLKAAKLSNNEDAFVAASRQAHGSLPIVMIA
jgi:hypothetical protein